MKEPSDKEAAAKAVVEHVQFESIPNELLMLHQWLTWRYEENSAGELKKPPFTPLIGKRADITKPETWGSFREAKQAYTTGKWDGIGLALVAGLIAIDIDDCIKDAKIDPKVEKYIRYLITYFEKSPSGRGVRGFLFGSLPGSHRKRGKLELYEDKRYVTITGQHLPFTPSTIGGNQERLNYFYGHIFPPNEKLRTNGNNHEIPQPPEKRGEKYTRVSERSPDEIIWFMLNKASNRDDLRRYVEGDQSLWGEKARHASKSNAVYRFVRHLVYWTDGDRNKIQAIVRKSKLYDEKWERVGDMTIDHALHPPENQ